MLAQPIRNAFPWCWEVRGFLWTAEGAVNIVYRPELAQSGDDPEVRKAKTEEFRTRFANPFIAAERGYLDDIIGPHETRSWVIKALRMVDTMPKKKHGNIPL